MSAKQIGQAPKKHSSGTMVMVRRIGTGIVSVVIVVCLLVAFSLIQPSASPFNAALHTTDDVSQQVSPKVLDQYCPAQMDLMDTGSYGDAEFHSSTGNITSRTQYAAIGSIFHSQVTAVNDEEGEHATVLEGKSVNDIALASADSQKNATLFETRILTAGNGTGAAGSLISWATNGDISGVSAATCMSTAKTHRFLVPATTAGNTEQLIVANPSDRATTVELAVWGTSKGRVAVATNGTVSVGAGKSASINLGAAAAKEQGLYVTITSSTSPVGAVVRSIAMDGLTPHGSDFALPLAQAANDTFIPVVSGDNTTANLLMYADEHNDATVTWLTTHGAKQAGGQHTIEEGHVVDVDLGTIPDDTYGIAVHGTAPLVASARVVQRGNDGQQDFALANGTPGYQQSAIAVSEGTQGTIALVNTADTKLSVSLQGIDGDGNVTTTKDIDIDAESSAHIALDELGDHTVAVYAQADRAGLAWGAFVTNNDVHKAKLAGIGYLTASDLDVTTITVSVRNDGNLVH